MERSELGWAGIGPLAGEAHPDLLCHHFTEEDVAALSQLTEAMIAGQVTKGANAISGNLLSFR